jgi:methylmalonyl-CoA mutase C-terminal domain/subunit
MTLAPLVVEALRARGAEIPVVVGGIIPDRDIEPLRQAGIAAVMGPGALAEDIVTTMRNLFEPAA